MTVIVLWFCTDCLSGNCGTCLERGPRVLDLLGYDAGRDTIDDLFPGTGVMAQVACQGDLFGGEVA